MLPINLLTITANLCLLALLKLLVRADFCCWIFFGPFEYGLDVDAINQQNICYL